MKDSAAVGRERPAHVADAVTAVRPSLARGAGQRVLVAVAQPDIGELLGTTLELAGYRVTLAVTLNETLGRLGAERFDLLVADLSLPGIQSLPRPVIAHRPPVLYLLPPDSLEVILPELDLGEKDYVTKPVRVPEVLARMLVLLRAAAPGPREPVLRYDDLVLDDRLCSATRAGRPLDLTPAEYRLLRHFLVNAHRVVSKEQIGRYVWGEFRCGNAIEQLVSRLRRKVDEGAAPLLHTRRGFGYWLGRVESLDG